MVYTANQIVHSLALSKAVRAGSMRRRKRKREKERRVEVSEIRTKERKDVSFTHDRRATSSSSCLRCTGCSRRRWRTNRGRRSMINSQARKGKTDAKGQRGWTDEIEGRRVGDQSRIVDVGDFSGGRVESDLNLLSGSSRGITFEVVVRASEAKKKRTRSASRFRVVVTSTQPLRRR